MILYNFAEEYNMDIKKGEELRKEWGGKHCDHPSFEKETQGAPIVKGMGYVEVKTVTISVLNVVKCSLKMKKKQ